MAPMISEPAEFTTYTHDDVDAAFDGTPPDVVMHTIGSAPDHMTDADAMRAVRAFVTVGTTPTMLTGR